MQLRKMQLQDIAAIVKLEEETFAVPWSQEAFVDELEHDIAEYWVLINDDELIAYFGYWQILNEAHITNVAVSAKHRRKGYASILLEKLLTLAREKHIESITLEVRESNHSAQALYKKFGFIEAGRRKRYYSDNNEDAIIMWLHTN